MQTGRFWSNPVHLESYIILKESGDLDHYSEWRPYTHLLRIDKITETVSEGKENKM